MFDQEPMLEYSSSPERINKIILLGAINAIFITHSIRTTYGAAKKQREKPKIQQATIDKLCSK